MAFHEQTQLELPGSFPSAAYDQFMGAARSVLLHPKKSPAWKEFGGSSNLIAWRFRACIEDLEAYLASWAEGGSNTSFEQIYVRERALFGMFVSGVSCVESTCYAIYALVSDPKVLGVPFGEKEQLSCTPKSLRNALDPHPNADDLSEILTDVLGSDEWSLWKKLRNRMAHRSNLPRIIYASTGPLPRAKAIQFASTSSTPELLSDEEWLLNQGVWLSSTVTRLLDGGRARVS